jgi:hypothetical protein
MFDILEFVGVVIFLFPAFWLCLVWLGVMFGVLVGSVLHIFPLSYFTIFTVLGARFDFVLFPILLKIVFLLGSSHKYFQVRCLG